MLRHVGAGPAGPVLARPRFSKLIVFIVIIMIFILNITITIATHVLLGHVSAYSCIAYSSPGYGYVVFPLEATPAKGFHLTERLVWKQVVQRVFQPILGLINGAGFDESSDSAFCHICAKAEGEGKLKTSSKDLSFIHKA